MIQTPRLILRPPTDADRDALFALNADPRVGDWLGGPLSRAEADALVDRVLERTARDGFSLWAVQRRDDAAVIGMAGLMAMGADLPPGPAIEVGWRFAPDAWGHGYATEAARAAVAWGFAQRPEVAEIIAITAVGNLRSQAVMRRIGMTPQPERDFDHPRLPPGHPLRRHVTWTIRRPA